MTNQEDLNKSPYLMVAHCQVSKYSIAVYQIIHSFEIGISWLLNLFKLLLLLTWIIYGNDYLRFKTIWSTQEIMTIYKGLRESRLRYILFTQETEHYLTFIKIRGKCMYSRSDNGFFLHQENHIINVIASIFKISKWILKKCFIS